MIAMADIVFSTARVPPTEHNHSAILQDIIPDTLQGTDCAAAVEKDLCSRTCLGDQLSSAGCTTSCGCPSENAGKWTQPIRSRQVSQHLLCCVHCLPSSYLCLFNINPKVCRNMVAPVKVLYQLPHSPVQGEGGEITPSCASSEIIWSKEVPFLYQTNEQKFSKQLKYFSVLPNLYYLGLPSSLTGLRDVNPSVFIILKLGRLIRGP